MDMAPLPGDDEDEEYFNLKPSQRQNLWDYYPKHND